MNAKGTAIAGLPIPDSGLAREVTSPYRLRHYEEDR
jgi:hypothetical protein